MANFAKTSLLGFLIFLVMGLCRSELFVNTNYNKYGTNPYLAPVFNETSSSAQKPSDVPIEHNQGQITSQLVPAVSVVNVQQAATEANPASSAQPEITSSTPQYAQSSSVNEIIPSEGNSPSAQSENTVQGSTTAPAAVSTLENIQPGSTLLPFVPSAQPVVPDDSNNRASNGFPQNPVPVSPVPSFPNAQQGSNFYPVPPSTTAPVPQNSFLGSQASFPSPNYNNNPYLQGLVPSGSNSNVQSQGFQPVPPQNLIPPQNVAPPQNFIPVPPQNVAPPQNLVPVPPQNAVPVPPLNTQNPVPVPPQVAVPLPPVAVSPPNSPLPIQPPSISNNNPVSPPQGVQIPVAPPLNLNNNPYLQNLNPGVAPQNPTQVEVSSQNSNSFFPSVPISSVPQTPTQNYPTPCTNFPNAVPSSQVPVQGTTYQPQNYYPATIVAKHLRSRCLRPRGQFPSDKCNYFVNCWDNDVREQPCPPGLAFSSKGYCDFEGNVDCNGLPVAALPVTAKPDGDVFTPQAGVSFASQPSFAPPVQAAVPSQPVPPSAAPTVQIVQNPQPTVPVELEAPAKQTPPVAVSPSIQPTLAPAAPSIPPAVADAVTQSSAPSPQPNSAVTIPAAWPSEQNPSSNAPPSSSVAPTAAPVPSTTVDPVLKAKCLKPRGQFPTEICNRYINCWDDAVREEECPKGMAFSEKGYCDFDFSVNCGNRTYDRKSYADSNCPAPHGTFRDKSNCGEYYTCMFGKVVARYGCPSGLSYNDVLGVCDYSNKVDCTHAPLVYPPTENLIEMKEIKEGAPNTSTCTPGSIYRLNPQCTSAVLCRSGFTEIVECPSGLAYDSVTDKCLLPHLAKC